MMMLAWPRRGAGGTARPYHPRPRAMNIGREASVVPALGSSARSPAGAWVRLPHAVISDFAGMPGLPPPRTAEPGVYRARSNVLGALHLALPGGDLGIKPGEFERLPDIDWIIIGGESGNGCRPNELSWTRGIIGQIEECTRRVPLDPAPFLKQLGGNAVDREAGLVGARFSVKGLKKAERAWIKVRLKDDHGGNEDEFPADLRGYQRMPQVEVPLIPVASRRAPAPPGQLGLGL